jgi:predicted nucleic-acid-binding protein
VRAIDTNVAARFLLADDPHQYEIAKAVVAGGVYVPTTVLLELGWLLGSRYAQSRGAVAAVLEELIDLPTVTVEDASLVRWALGRYSAGADLADMVHLLASRSAESFATFDSAIEKDAGPDTPLQVEILA